MADKNEMRLSEVLRILQGIDPSKLQPIGRTFRPPEESKAVPLPMIPTPDFGMYRPAPLGTPMPYEDPERRPFTDQEAWDLLRGMGR